MFRLESKKAIQRFGDELQNVLETCGRDADDLKSAYSKGPLGTGEEAVRFSSTMQGEVEQVRNKVPPLVRLSSDAPRAGNMLDAAFAHLKAITDVFDRFEERLESAYDIAPVVPRKQADETVFGTKPTVPDHLVNDMPALSTMDSQQVKGVFRRPTTPSGRTPQSAIEKEVDMPIPATPKPEDFGIVSDDVVSELNALGAASSSKLAAYETFSNASTAYRTTRVAEGSLRRPSGYASSAAYSLDLDGNYEENVQKSIRENGIQTKAQLDDMYASRRNQAFSTMMCSTTPVLQSGGVGRVRDYTGLADGYYKSRAGSEMTPRVETHRQLNFDETPRVGGIRTAPEDEVRQHIVENYEKLGFWKGKANPDVLRDAVTIIQNSGRRVLTKCELTRELVEAIPDTSPTLLMTCLTKLHLLLVQKRHGEEQTFQLADL